MNWIAVIKTVCCAVMMAAAALGPLPGAAQGSQTRPEVALPAGEIRNVLLDNCVTCHGIDEYAFHAMSREEWDKFIETVHQRDTVDKEVSLSPKDEKILLDYLADNFGPDFIPFPRDYVPQEISEFYTNADGRVFLESKCSGCHTTDTVLDQRHTQEGWRQILVAERERIRNDPSFGGFRGLEDFTDEELEKMAEWLNRVRGTNPFE